MAEVNPRRSLDGPRLDRLLAESQRRARSAVEQAVDTEAGLQEIARPRPTVLVVEDDPSMSEALALILARSGFEVVGVAIEGGEAVAAVRRTRPDLVTMDLMLPGMDGWVATEIIAREHPSTRVVCVTAKDERADLLRGLAAGAVGFLTKPFSVDELVATLREVLRGGYPIAAAIMASLSPPGTARTAPVPAISLFTELEATVLRHLADNLSTPQIAAATGFTVQEVTELQALIAEKIKLRTALQDRRHRLGS
ncbi:response regulator transcription factor [Nonomuraea sp. KM88]|uniref:response regulator transcription factor n=1 Tax=Nonomuraea sp. KM88 TaxID=3457427 RepID=UPI003FCCA358